jgi:hypothetical protein
MKEKNISSLIVVSLLFVYAPLFQVQAQQTPEDQCFTHLRNAAQNNPNFQGLNLRKVQKINGKNGENRSAEFSLASHRDFRNAFENYQLPVIDNDLSKYPYDMDEVSNRHKFFPRIHKSNRTNSASVIFENNIKTPIDHWMNFDGASAGRDIQNFFTGHDLNGVNKHVRQVIDGHFVNTRYMTFGRESDLELSFPSRATNPAEEGYYSVGRPIKDMREYLMYTHHLTNGTLLSCELFRMIPQSDFELKDFDITGKGIYWLNYGGSMLSETDVGTTPIANGKFRVGTIGYSITEKRAPFDKLLRFEGINVSFNNGSNFLNPFVTLGLFEESVRDAKNGTNTFLEMRRDFYNRIRASGMGIANGMTGAAPSVGPEVTQGQWCGYTNPGQKAANAIQLCKGQLPGPTTCPAGYEYGGFLNFGSGTRSSCFKVITGQTNEPPEEGLMCGMKLSGDPNRVALCDGFDPQMGCPAGYTTTNISDPNYLYGGSWFTCFKDDTTTNEEPPDGSICGLRLIGQDRTPRNCGEFNLRPNPSNPSAPVCPTGYNIHQWANVNAVWGRWSSCFKGPQIVPPSGATPPTPPTPPPCLFKGC